MAETAHAGGDRMRAMVAEMEGRDLWGELFELRDEQRARAKDSVWLVRGDDLPWQNNAQGIMRWYMHPHLKSPCISTLNIFVQEIPPGSRSGRMQYPGNMVMFIMAGEGYTTVDGHKHYWAKGDVVQIPVKPNGVVFQHFNSSDEQPCRFICAEPNTVHSAGLDRHGSFEQMEKSPDFKA